MFPSSSPRIKHPENHDAEVDLFFLTAHMSLNDIYIVFFGGGEIIHSSRCGTLSQAVTRNAIEKQPGSRGLHLDP